MTFTDGAAELGTGVAAGNGQWTFTTSALVAGGHTITAEYGGDANFSAGTGGMPPYTVTAAATTTVLTASANPAVANQKVTFTATVSAVSPSYATPKGSVIFRVNGSQAGPAVTLVNGVAVCSLAFGNGSYSISATYIPGPNFAGGPTASLTETVLWQSNILLSASPNPGYLDQPVTFTATVSGPGGTPTGTVTFANAGVTLGTASVGSNGVATYITLLPPGSNSITATYNGSSNYVPCTSATLTETINQPSPTISGPTKFAIATVGNAGGAISPVVAAIVNGPSASNSETVEQGQTVLLCSRPDSGRSGHPRRSHPGSDYRAIH